MPEVGSLMELYTPHLSQLIDGFLLTQDLFTPRYSTSLWAALTQVTMIDKSNMIEEIGQ